MFSAGDEYINGSTTRVVKRKTAIYTYTNINSNRTRNYSRNMKSNMWIYIRCNSKININVVIRISSHIRSEYSERS